jgi:hypothetical protein
MKLSALAALLLGKVSRYSLDRRLGGHQGRFGVYREEKNLFPVMESNPDSSVVQPIT